MAFLIRYINPLVVLFLFIGCGIEVDRISMYGGTQKEIVLNLQDGDKVFFWTDLDIKYNTGVKLWYELEILHEGKSAGKADIDALNVNPVFNKVIEEKEGWTYMRYYGKMIGSYKTKKAGKFTFQVKLQSDKIKSIEIRKADFIIKK